MASVVASRGGSRKADSGIYRHRHTNTLTLGSPHCISWSLPIPAPPVPQELTIEVGMVGVKARLRGRAR